MCLRAFCGLSSSSSNNNSSNISSWCTVDAPSRNPGPMNPARRMSFLRFRPQHLRGVGDAKPSTTPRYDVCKINVYIIALCRKLSIVQCTCLRGPFSAAASDLRKYYIVSQLHADLQQEIVIPASTCHVYLSDCACMTVCVLVRVFDLTI